MMRKFIVAALVVACAAAGALGQSQSAPTLRIIAEDGNKLPAELMYGNTKVKPLRLRPGTNTPITIKDTDFFVQQQYVDFLGRFPDQGGFAFWQGNITQCGNNQGCIDAQRVNVSAAFFLSIEFKESGFLVYRTHRAAFGNLPGKPVPVVRENFIPESRSISADVIVGTDGWPERLRNNKNAYMLAFVGRSDFRALYPSSLTPEQFVDGLNAKAGNVLDAAERAALIGELTANNTDAGRASVLLKVAEDGTLHQRELNSAFVFMQYVGYLKRNPDGLPDTNFNGFQFWLDKLNQFNGDFVRAEMVRAFLDSIEYNARF
jgi:hypothetical protein